MTRVVSAVQYHDYILIFCENGDIYKMIVHDMTVLDFTFQRISEFRPHL